MKQIFLYLKSNFLKSVTRPDDMLYYRVSWEKGTKATNANIFVRMATAVNLNLNRWWRRAFDACVCAAQIRIHFQLQIHKKCLDTRRVSHESFPKSKKNKIQHKNWVEIFPRPQKCGAQIHETSFPNGFNGSTGVTSGVVVLTNFSPQPPGFWVWVWGFRFSVFSFRFKF